MASFAEGVPVVLMEAMAAGVPVVATQIAGIPELVEDEESGYLVPPGDVDALADRAMQLLADPGLRSAMGAKGRAKVAAEFNIATEADRLCKILTISVGGRIVPTDRDAAPVLDSVPQTAPGAAAV
jgi:glycosyltransferase involved in cell wall biosynthesis